MQSSSLNYYSRMDLKYGQLNLAKAAMFRAKAVRLACLLCHVVKQCQSDDDSLGEKTVIKPQI